MLLGQCHVLSEQCSDARSQPCLMQCLATCTCLPSVAVLKADRKETRYHQNPPVSLSCETAQYESDVRESYEERKSETYKDFELWWYEQLAATD